jgi:hypothetical protein
VDYSERRDRLHLKQTQALGSNGNARLDYDGDFAFLRILLQGCDEFFNWLDIVLHKLILRVSRALETLNATGLPQLLVVVIHTLFKEGHLLFFI